MGKRNRLNTNRERVLLHRSLSGIALAGALIVAAACATSSAPVLAESPSRVEPVGNFGPKKTIAVARFDANGAFVAHYGGYDVVGGGLAAQLSTALAQSGRYTLVDRSELPNVLREQEMGLRGLTTANTAPRTGELLGAQLLIRGSVTSFEQADKGGGFQIGGPIAGSLIGGLAARGDTGHVAMDLRVIDTTTGRVVATTTIEKKVSRSSFALTGATRGVRFGGDAYQRTAIGRATREAIEEAVRWLEHSANAVPWTAQVAKFERGRVYVNAGSNANLKTGDTLRVYRVIGRVLDPVTGELLGTEEVEIGSLQIDSVNTRYSTARFSGRQGPRAGDLVRYVRSAPSLAQIPNPSSSSAR